MKLNWLSAIILFLLILNLSMVSTFVLRQQKMKEKYEHHAPHIQMKKMRHGPKVMEFMEHDLDLTKKQQEQFSELMSKYKDEWIENKKAIRHLERKLVQEMTQTKSDTALINKYTREIGLLTAQSKILSFKQYNELRSICKPAQIERLDSLLHGFTDHQPMHKKHKHMHKRGFHH
jgi:Spy/CpxP family protein refolding chaperone